MDPGKFFECIGEFCVTFEHCCRELEDFALELLADAGLTDEDTAHILLAGLTASPLVNLVRPLHADRLKSLEGGEILVRTAEQVFIAFNELTSLRNVIVHAKWIEPMRYPAWRRSDGRVLGRKIKSSGQGNSTLYPNWDQGDFEASTGGCIETEKLIGKLRYAFARRQMSEDQRTSILNDAKAVRKVLKRMQARLSTESST